MGVDEILFEAEEKMEKSVEHLTGQLKTIRTGRASPGLIEGVKVDYYGAPTPIRQLANISSPEPQLLAVKPFDPGALGEIEKAILKADLGLVPNNDGKLIRIAIPPLSEDRRKQIAGVVKEMAEQAKVGIRNVRRDANKQADTEQKDKGMTEDDCKRCKDRIQELTKTYEGKVDDAIARKTDEILTV